MSDEQPKTFVELYDALDPKEQRFVDEYLESFNSALAARRVWGTKAAKQKGYMLLRRPDVDAAIQAGIHEQNARMHNDPDRIVRELMLSAFADPADLVDAKGNPLPLRKLAPEIRRAIASIDVEHEKTTTEDVDVVEGKDGAEPTAKKGKKIVTTQTRVVKYRLVPKTPSLELLGKRLKMWTDRVELDVSDRLAERLQAARERARLDTQTPPSGPVTDG